jgi:2-methylcitrate dehydratase PrpD
MENILFKISYPAEFHAQTAVECAMALHGQVKDRIHEVEKIVIRSQESALRIIDKKGPLTNPADRDHCIRYMVAIPLIFGRLTAADYEDSVAGDPRVDALRDKTICVEDKRFTEEYLDPDKRAIGNGVQVFFSDGTSSEEVSIDYPLGHRRRRAEGLPLLIEKFERNLGRRFPESRSREIADLLLDRKRLSATPVDGFMDLLVK